ncbi:hypothetical protein B7G54_02360 [Burkholderia puraquae]|uniref:Uncharacterized protein n=1 Tax=Burkholderia puraquae TaxID=1904757 RepID=A0A1X1PP39_9BURK|nr:hypothetical protein B7G54_02360 [Burkholderia puraquae]
MGRASYPPFPIRNQPCRERVLPIGAGPIANRLDADPLRVHGAVAETVPATRDRERLSRSALNRLSTTPTPTRRSPPRSRPARS